VGSYLFRRVLIDGKDSRFDVIKKSPRRFSVAWVAQTFWISLCLMPVIALNAVPASALVGRARVLPTDILGLGLWVTGFAFEVIADAQKSRWAHGKRTKQHDEEFMTTGLFSKWFVLSTLVPSIASARTSNCTNTRFS
jgi:steroid 5-alpha reductase family enzyme